MQQTDMFDNVQSALHFTTDQYIPTPAWLLCEASSQVPITSADSVSIAKCQISRFGGRTHVFSSIWNNLTVYRHALVPKSTARPTFHGIYILTDFTSS